MEVARRSRDPRRLVGCLERGVVTPRGEELERRAGSLLLSTLPARPFAHRQATTLEDRGDREGLLVGRTDGAHPLGEGLGVTVALGPFLQPALGRLRRCRLPRRVQAVVEQASEPEPSGLHPLRQEQGTRHRLERGSQQGRAGGATGLRLTTPEQQESVEPELESDRRQRVAIDQRSAASGQEPLVLVGETLVEDAADDEADDGVAKELEPLVVAVNE